MLQPFTKKTVSVLLLIPYLGSLAAYAKHPPRMPATAVAELMKQAGAVCPVAVNNDGHCILPRGGQHYGAWRPTRELINGHTLRGHRHEGADISGEGEEVQAIIAGEVVFIGRDERSAEGWYFKLKHDIGGVVLYSKYMHMARRGFAPGGLHVGSVVPVGAQLGLVGSTGVKRSEPHLHFVLEDENGVPINPEPTLMASRAVDTPLVPATQSKLALRVRRSPAARQTAGPTKRPLYDAEAVQNLKTALAMLARRSHTPRAAALPSVPVETEPSVEPDVVVVPDATDTAPADEPSETAAQPEVATPVVATAPPPAPLVRQSHRSAREVRTPAVQYKIRGLNKELVVIVQAALVLGKKRSQATRQAPATMVFTVEEANEHVDGSATVLDDKVEVLNFSYDSTNPKQAEPSPTAQRAPADQVIEPDFGK